AHAVGLRQLAVTDAGRLPADRSGPCRHRSTSPTIPGDDTSRKRDQHGDEPSVTCRRQGFHGGQFYLCSQPRQRAWLADAVALIRSRPVTDVIGWPPLVTNSVCVAIKGCRSISESPSLLSDGATISHLDCA